MPLQFQEPWALLLLLLAVALISVTYRRLRGTARWRRRTIVALRLVILGAFALALSQPLLRVADDRLSVVLALDVSGSMSSETQALVADWVEQALRERGPHDQVGSVAFARDAHVIRPPSSNDSIVLPAAVQVDETNLSAGLRMAGALLQGEGGRRIVVVSDGWATTGDPEAVLQELEGVQIMALPVRAGTEQPQVLLERIDMPSYARQGETVDAQVWVASTEDTSAVLEVTVNGERVSNRDLELEPGRKSLSLPLEARAPGFHRVEATVSSQVDAIPHNNTAYSFLVVKERPHVLVVQEREGEAEPVRAMLEASGMDVTVIPAPRLPPLHELERYDAMVLSNVSATSFSLDQLNVINAYVRSLGHGLVALGGPTTYALGNYGGTPLEQALPVSASIPTREEETRIALLLIVDRSGSMALRSEGVSAMEMANEAAILATESLRPGDAVGVLAFDMRQFWVVPPQELEPDLGNLPEIQDAIARLEPDGGTDIYAALLEGYRAIHEQPAVLRHIVLLSDGVSFEADYEDLATRVRASGISLSTIGLGRDVDAELLSDLARWGEGRYYFTEQAADLPRLMISETAIAKRTAQVEGTVRPRLVRSPTSSPILRDIAEADVPLVGGYIATTPKDSAQVVLRIPETEEPLLAQWHYGLGKAVAWTSDLGLHWTHAWRDWEETQRFWDQAVRWVMPNPADRDLRLEVSRDGARVTIRAESLRDGQFVDLADTRASVTLPDGRQADLRMRQTAPGRYEAHALAEDPGVYQVDVVQHDESETPRQETIGFVVREDEELAGFGVNERLLRHLASETGGRVIERPEEVFARDFEPSAQRWEPLWWRLLLLGLLLFPVDIALRRLPWPPTRALWELAAVPWSRVRGG